MVKKDFLNFGKYLEQNEVIVTPYNMINPVWALVVDKRDFKKGTDFSNPTEKDLIDPKMLGMIGHNAKIVLYDGRSFDTNFGDVISVDNMTVTEGFKYGGYVRVGDAYRKKILATGEVVERDAVIDPEEIKKGKLLGDFLEAIEEDKLKDFLKDFEMSEENLELMNNSEFKLIAKNAVKLAWQKDTVDTKESMVKNKKSKTEIIEFIKENKELAKAEVQMLETFFKEAKKEITTEEGTSDLDKALDEINSL